MMKHLRGTLLGLVVFFALAPVLRAQAQNPSDALRERLNKIYYWQMADELKLSPKLEKEMVHILEDIQTKRQASLKDRENCFEDLRKIEKTLSEKNTGPILDRLQKTLGTLAKLDIEEHDRLKASLGTETLGRFYLVRETVTKRVRDLLKSNENAEPAKP